MEGADCSRNLEVADVISLSTSKLFRGADLLKPTIFRNSTWALNLGNLCSFQPNLIF